MKLWRLPFCFQFSGIPFPKPFNQVKIRRVRGQVNQMDVELFCFALYGVSSLIPGIVKDYTDSRSSTVLISYFLQKCFHYFRTAIFFCKHHSGLRVDGVDSSDNIQAPSAGVGKGGFCIFPSL